MNVTNINSMADLTDDKVASLAGLAQNLSMQSDDVIQTITNSPVLNPAVQQVLTSENVRRLLGEDLPGGLSSDVLALTGDEGSFGLLSFPENDAFAGGIWADVKNLFTGLRRKVGRIFCQVVKSLGDDQDLNVKKIIKDVLLALVPVFAASTGLMPLVLPIVVSLAAMLIKYGVRKVCPA